MTSKGLQLVHVELKQANEFVNTFHRHHKPVVGHRFSIGTISNGELCGVAIVGRPVARGSDQVNTLEVTRLCTDATKNACSFLYGAAARAGKALGYTKIQTYVLETEPATTLKAAGWKFSHHTAGGSWNQYDREGTRREDQPTCKKQCWYKILKGHDE